MRNNKKGFTLVELLAVIVILALIMGIAVVSIGGVLQSARQSTFKETAATIIHGVRQQLTLANKLPTAATGSSTKYYGFSSKLLDKDIKLPLGGTIYFNTSGTPIGSGLITELTAAPSPTCGKTNASSYVKVVYDSTNLKYKYYICLMSQGTDPYIEETSEEDILNTDKTSMIKTGRLS